MCVPSLHEICGSVFELPCTQVKMYGGGVTHMKPIYHIDCYFSVACWTKSGHCGLGIRKKVHQVNDIKKKAHQENCPSAKVIGRKIAHPFVKISLRHTTYDVYL